MCIQCARGGCAGLGTAARPLLARLRQHVVPPQPAQLEFKVHPPPPNQLKGAFLLSASVRNSPQEYSVL